MEHDIRFYAVISVLVLISIAAVLTLNPFLIIASLAVSALLIPFYRLHYLVESVLFKRTNLILLLDSCELSGERSAAIRRIGDMFCATTASLLENSAGKPIERDRIENIIANAHCAFRLVMQVERIDMNKLLDRLQTRRGIKEIELARLGSQNSGRDASKAAMLRRQIDQLEHDIERISSGSPLKISQYIITSAVSENRFAAQERAKSQICELASEFGALIGSKSEILSGEELVRVLKFDSTMF